METSIQLRMLTGDLTYKDIRQYLDGISIPNTCIKMINGLDGYRFGFAYIRLTSQADKQKALARHNGNIRGSNVQVGFLSAIFFLNLPFLFVFFFTMDDSKDGNDEQRTAILVDGNAVKRKGRTSTMSARLST